MDATDVLIWALVIAAAVLFTVVRMWRRHIRKQAGAIHSVAENIRLLRRMAGVAPRLEPVTAATPVPEGLAPLTRELEAAGFRILGDRVERHPEGGVSGVARWFVSGDGLSFGWVGVTAAGPAAMLLVSEDPATGFLTTMRAPDAPSVAVPPSVRQRRVGWEEGLDAAVRAHAEGLAELENPMRITDLDTALASFGRLYGLVGAWRSVQDPDRLLEEDVRRIVGGRYEGFDTILIEMVRSLDSIDDAMAEMERRARAR